jgi:hypothetical protein
MDNDFNEIDDLFKDRFEGLKDHSVSPTSQWGNFESQLNKSVINPASHSGGLVLKKLSMAASIVGIIGITFLAQSDVSHLSNMGFDTADQHSKAVINSANSWVNNQKATFINSSAFKGAFDLSLVDTKDPETIEQVVTSASDLELFDKPTNNAARNLSIGAPKTTKNTPEYNIALASAERSSNSIENIAVRNNIDFMSPIEKTARAINLADIDRTVESSDYFNKTGIASTFFLRLGVRFGNGESNSPQNPNAWTANAMASVGYKRAINTHYGWMAELAYLRRSGNGLERNQNLEVERSYSAYNTSFNAGGNNPLEVVPDFKVDRSLVASRLDYAQIPISMYYDANQKTSLNAGIYGEFLFNAQNKAYVIYNDVNYVALNTSGEEKRSVEGLNRFRYGVSMGANYEIMQNLRFDVRALIPVNSTFNSHADLCANRTANRSLDFLISLKYSI